MAKCSVQLWQNRVRNYRISPKRTERIRKMIPRLLADYVTQLAGWFPVVSITGPRQSGKSTLVRATFPDHEYLNLEDLQTRQQATDDPVGFIANHSNRMIIDEAQYAPDLFSQIQVASDKTGATGQYILSGSQNFLLLKNITQSLAGRVGLAKLMPLSYAEAHAANPKLTPDEFMFTGGYPRAFTSGMPATTFFDNYLETYVQRDVSDYLDVRNLTDFRKFLRLCALSGGNLINYSNLADDADISRATSKAWTSILESSYIAFELAPYHPNTRKRLVRTPKLFFHDTGLLCHLLGITSLKELLLSERLGAVYENFIIAETLKRHLNAGHRPNLFFYRDDSKREVDLVDATNQAEPELIEIKSGQTYHDRFAAHLNTIGDELDIPASRRYVVARVAESYTSRGVNVCNAKDWVLRE